MPGATLEVSTRTHRRMEVWQSQGIFLRRKSSGRSESALHVLCLNRVFDTIYTQLKYKSKYSYDKKRLLYSKNNYPKIVNQLNKLWYTDMLNRYKNV